MAQPMSIEGVASIKRDADEICRIVSESYFLKHPDCLKGNADRVKQMCKSDFFHHLDFLLTAMSTATSKIFSDYATWLRNVLEKRNMSTEHPFDSFTFIKEEFLARVGPLDHPVVIEVIVAGLVALRCNPVKETELAKTTKSTQTEYSLAISNGERLNAESLILKEVKNGTSLTTASVDIIQLAMYHIGHLWENNKISVAQEHLATAISQNILAKAYSVAEFSDFVDKHVLCACIEGNHHSLGLRMVSDAFETSGWESTFLGANTPNSAIISQIELEKPDVLALSLSMPEQLLNLRGLLDMLKTNYGAKMPNIVVGGLTINQHQSTIRHLSIDGYFVDAKQLYLDLKS